MEFVEKIYRKSWKIIVVILLVVSGCLCVLQTQKNLSDIVEEVSYVGDLEWENEKNNQTELEEEEEPIPVVVERGTFIRVLLMNTGYQSIKHDQVIVSSSEGLELTYRGETFEIKEQVEVFIVTEEEIGTLDESMPIITFEEEMESTLIIKENSIFCISEDSEDDIYIEALESGEIKVNSIDRNYGNPCYEGSIEVFWDDGSFVLVNELDLELYLQGVLPSEMPSTYEIEALRAQAVCARSYAYMHMGTYAYPEYKAHINDSTDYQVYNNSEETDIANEAIADTKGEMIVVDGEVVTTYFFSTSCGETTDVTAWGREEIGTYTYLQGVSVLDKDGEDYEKDLAWYRWEVTLSEKELETILNNNLSVEIGTLESVRIIEEGTGGVALAFFVKGSEASTIVETEYEIRKALGSTSYEIVRQNGSVVQGSKLLPSAFIEIEKSDETYIITGGGYGHGIGMSQNGANEMAKDGWNYQEILMFFYTDSYVKYVEMK